MQKLIRILIFFICLGVSSLAFSDCFVATKKGNIRSGPGTNYEIIGQIEPGEIILNIPYFAYEPEWLCVEEEKLVFDKSTKENGIALWKGKKPAIGNEAVILKLDKDGNNLFDTINKGLIIEYKGEIKEIKALTVDVKKVWAFNSQKVIYFPNIPNKKEKKCVHQSLGVRLSYDYECDNYSEKLVKNLTLRQKLLNDNPQWSKGIKNIIEAGKIKIGMTPKQAIASWGNPDRINEDVGSWGKDEQWIYNDHYYLYFRNGKLTSWQKR